MIPSLDQLNYLLENIHKIYKVEDNTLLNLKTRIYSNAQKRVYIQVRDNQIKTIHTEIYHDNFDQPILSFANEGGYFIQYVPITETILIKENSVKRFMYEHVDNNDEVLSHNFELKWDGTILKYHDCRGNYWDKDMGIEKFFISPKEHIFNTIERCAKNQFDFPIRQTSQADCHRVLTQRKRDMVNLTNRQKEYK